MTPMVGVHPLWLGGGGQAASPFVAVGRDGGVFTSPGGVTWARQASGVTEPLVDITYGGGLFVAVGGSSGDFGVILTSPDGIVWTRREVPKTVYTRSVFSGAAYGNGLFVTGCNNAVLTSPDGIVWTERLHGVSGRVHAITFGNGLFVAAFVGNGAVITSSDGIVWTKRDLPSGMSGLSDITHGNGLFVGVYGSTAIVTSPDGIVWTRRALPGFPTTELRGVAYGNGMFIATGGDGAALASYDGITWSGQRNLDPDVGRISFAGGLFFVSRYLGGFLTGTGREGTYLPGWPLRGADLPLLRVAIAAEI